MKRVLWMVIVAVILCLTGCSSGHKPLNAECTYQSRGGCGQVVPMQQFDANL